MRVQGKRKVTARVVARGKPQTSAKNATPSAPSSLPAIALVLLLGLPALGAYGLGRMYDFDPGAWASWGACVLFCLCQPLVVPARVHDLPIVIRCMFGQTEALYGGSAVAADIARWTAWTVLFSCLFCPLLLAGLARTMERLDTVDPGYGLLKPAIVCPILLVAQARIHGYALRHCEGSTVTKQGQCLPRKWSAKALLAGLERGQLLLGILGLWQQPLAWMIGASVERRPVYEAAMAKAIVASYTAGQARKKAEAELVAKLRVAPHHLLTAEVREQIKRAQPTTSGGLVEAFVYVHGPRTVFGYLRHAELPNDRAPGKERRECPRQDWIRTGLLKFENRMTSVPVTTRNVSTNAAGLGVSSHQSIEANLEGRMRLADIEFNVQVVAVHARADIDFIGIYLPNASDRDQLLDLISRPDPPDAKQPSDAS